MTTARDVINLLQLEPHPEGGFFREIYRSAGTIPNESLDSKYSGDRNYASVIYFLLRANDVSKFHRLLTDEIWHFHYGTTIEIFMLTDAQEPDIIRLGNGFLKEELPVALVKAGRIFGAKLADKEGFALISCTVSPGFDFDDFELCNKDVLLEKYPQHRDLIDLLT